MPRLFRQSPLNAIWEGSGNVIALDVLRVVSREPEALEAVRAEFAAARGANLLLDTHIDRWDRWFAKGAISESTARAFVEDTALALQASALRNTPQEVLDGFCAIRLSRGERSLAYGAFTADIAVEALVQRATPPI